MEGNFIWGNKIFGNAANLSRIFSPSDLYDLCLLSSSKLVTDISYKARQHI
jgi:hypothetical protein